MEFLKNPFKKEGIGKTEWEKEMGGIYEGDMQDGKPHGEGRFISRDKTIVREGSWLFGRLDGPGRTEMRGLKQYTDTDPDSVFWEGVYVMGEMHGYGINVCRRGRYEGNFVNSEWYGKGKFETWHGAIYEGNFLNGLAHGEGTLISKNGSVLYSGEWRNNYPVKKLNSPLDNTAIWAPNFFLNDQ